MIVNTLTSESLLAARQGPQAAAEFQRILDQRGIVVSEPHRRVARLQPGRAFALSGDKTKIRSALLTVNGYHLAVFRLRNYRLRAEGAGRAEVVSLKTSDIDSQRTVFQVQYMIWDEPSARTKAWLLRCGSRSRHSVISLTQNEGISKVFNRGLTTTEDLSGV